MPYRCPGLCLTLPPMREMSVAEQRYKAVLAVIADGRTITQVARDWGVSRQTMHAWLARCEADGLEGLVGHRGSGFGPVAVTRRCGTQSSTWTKPSNEAPSRTHTSYSERRKNFTWVKSSKSV